MGCQVLTILGKGGLLLLCRVLLHTNSHILFKLLFVFFFFKVMVCSSMETSQRFVLKQVDREGNAFAVRKVGLRKTILYLL